MAARSAETGHPSGPSDERVRLEAWPREDGPSRAHWGSHKSLRKGRRKGRDVPGDCGARASSRPRAPCRGYFLFQKAGSAALVASSTYDMPGSSRYRLVITLN